MTDDRRERHEQDGRFLGQDQRPDPGDQPTLADVTEEGQDAGFLAADSEDIGKSHVVAASSAGIRCPEEPRDDHAERNGPDEVAEEGEDDDERGTVHGRRGSV